MRVAASIRDSAQAGQARARLGEFLGALHESCAALWPCAARCASLS